MGSSHSCASDACRTQKTPTTRFKAISDQYTTLNGVQSALRKEGLESCNLIVAVDCTKSNEWMGKESFFGRSLHHLGPNPNPYEQAITIIGKTLASFDDDQLIPAYGFGDASCQDSRVFSFNPGDAPCQGLEAVLRKYRQLIPSVRLAGPTSFAPAIRQACRIVIDSGGKFHILLIIADGQVTRSSDLEPGTCSPQEAATAAALVEASQLPLSVVMVGVGDGPWEVMRHFDDALPQRTFDNFQFVNFTEIMARCGTDAVTREAQFALRALMEVPEQYKIIQRLRLLGRKVQLQQQCPPPLDPPGPPTATTAAGNTAAAGGYPLSLNQHHHHQQQQFNAYPDVNTPGLQQQAAPGWGMGMGMGMLPQPNGTHQQQQQQQQQWQHAPAGCAYPAVPSAVLPAAAAAVPQAAAAATAVPAADPLANPMFLCPITQDVMVEPVLAADGYTYDKHAIQDWLSRNNRSPMTNEALGSKRLLPNHALRSAIMEARQAAAASSR